MSTNQTNADNVRTNLLLRLTDYWRKVQVAAALEILKDERDGTGEEDKIDSLIRAPFTLESFLKGQCPQSLWGRAFKRLNEQRIVKHEKDLVRNPNAVMPEAATSISVVFSPYGLDIPGEKFPVNIVFGTANVDRNGIMTTSDVDSDLPPIWVGRSSLGPTDGLENETFPLTEADKYYDEIAAELKELETWPSDWESVLCACNKIWKKTGAKANPLSEALSKEYHLTPGWIRFEDKDSKKLTIIKIYEKLKEQILKGEVTQLYREAVLGENRNVFSGAKNHSHLGQMGGDYPLAPSQRSSLLAYLQTDNGYITAVNGPPGTGKTTLLQSVVATEMVSYALKEADAPLYIAGAATNQAVSNIIKAFREATESLKHPLADRWIPGLGRRYGVYFRGSKGEGLNLAKGSLVCIPSNFGSHKTYDSQEINRKIDDVTKSNDDKAEVAIDLFLAIGESQVARDFFLARAQHLLKKRFESLEAAKIHLRYLLGFKSDHIILYCLEADNLMMLIKKLQLEDYQTYDKALDRLNALETIAKDKISKLQVRHKSEKVSDNLKETDHRRIEDDARARLLENHETLENKESAVEKATISFVIEQIKKCDELKKQYDGLGEPTTLFAWISERYFPWTKNSKFIELKKIIEWMEQIGLANENLLDIKSMRTHIEHTIDGKRGCSEKIRQIEMQSSDRRETAKAQVSAFTLTVKEKRRQRQVAIDSREHTRLEESEALQLSLKEDLNAHKDLKLRFGEFQKKCKETTGDEAPREFDKIVGFIDTTLRVEAFLLATHYWECRFLMEVEKAGWRSQMNRKEAFKCIAMLTPCFVSTFDKMGTAFNTMKQGVLYPMWGLADTLIVDEAGQASPDKGAFAFALAKKAIVVGDNLQLPPVGSTDAGTIQTSIARSSGILDNKFVTSRGLLTGKIGQQKADGSLMRMASAAAFYDMSSTTQGMWLRDHFRCDPRIIAFCNDIWYTGETSLVPRRGEHNGSFVPHFGHVKVSGKNDNKSNQFEAEAIMAWINEHGKDLEAHYEGKPLHEIIAVLTPFSNQKMLLRKVRDSFNWTNIYESPEKIVMGTVHALQGAEREVILFSTVYDKAHPTYFFDREHTLLNVAVSRAKDSFIVFGSREIFADNTSADASRPSTVLSRYLMDKELFDVPPIPKTSNLPKTA